MRNTTTQQLALDLVDALKIAQSRHIVIVPTARSIAIWSPGVKVPGQVRQTIMANRREVKRLVAQSHMLVCPSPERHRASLDYENCRWACEICVKLDFWQRLASERRTA